MIVFDDSSDGVYTGAPVTEEMVQQAAERLGVQLPVSYRELLHTCNGGTLRNRCFPTSFPSSWSADHVCIDVILGIGGEWGVDVVSDGLIAEWGYPRIGVVFGITPSGGPDTVMLDYSECGSFGEPAVVYVDEDRVPKRIAGSFQEFLGGLMPCREFGEDFD